MLAYVTAWFAAAIVFLGVDAIWLSQMGPRLYRPAIGELLADKPDLRAAAAFYMLYITGLLMLAVVPALEKTSLTKAVWLGALVGAVAYGTYDLTNQATLKIWDLRLTIADIAWGSFVSALAAGLAYLVASRIGGMGGS